MVEVWTFLANGAVANNLYRKREGEESIQEEVDIDLSMLWPLGVVAADEQEADSSSTLCNKLLMQHCGTEDQGCNVSRDCDNVLQRQYLYNKEPQPGIRSQRKETDQDPTCFQSKQEVRRQGLHRTV